MAWITSLHARYRVGTSPHAHDPLFVVGLRADKVSAVDGADLRSCAGPTIRATANGAAACHRRPGRHAASWPIPKLAIRNVVENWSRSWEVGDFDRNQKRLADAEGMQLPPA